MNTRRLFYALWPDMRMRDRMRDFITPVAKLVEGRMVERRDWHVTLAYIGDFPENRVDELVEAKKAAPFEPFRLRFDRLEFWPRPRIAALVPPNVPPAMDILVEDLKGRIFAAGVDPEHHRVYRPHITVVRNGRPFETQRLAQALVTEWAGFELMESVTEAGTTSYRPVLNGF